MTESGIEIAMDNFVQMHKNLVDNYRSLDGFDGYNKYKAEKKTLLELHLHNLRDIIRDAEHVIAISELLLNVEFREEKILSTVELITVEKYKLEKLDQCRVMIIDALRD